MLTKTNQYLDRFKVQSNRRGDLSYIYLELRRDNLAFVFPIKVNKIPFPN